MKYVEMILSIDDANIIQFPSLLDRVVKLKEQGIKFIRMVTDAIRPSEVINYTKIIIYTFFVFKTSE